MARVDIVLLFAAWFIALWLLLEVTSWWERRREARAWQEFTRQLEDWR